MSEDSSNEQPKGQHTFSRRRFVQSTALLTNLSVGGKQVLEPLPVQARERVAGALLAITQAWRTTTYSFAGIA